MKLTIGCFRYETTAALFDASVTVDGADVEMRTARTIPEIFERMMRGHEFDVAELGLTFYLRTFGADSPFIAIPVFPNRVFRHSCIFVNAHSGIKKPGDLAGKTIGEFGMYSQDSGVWAKGILMDEYGFRPENNRWVIGGLDSPCTPFDFVPQTHPKRVEVMAAPEGEALGPMLEQGKIHALFSANVPQCVLDESPLVRRLFEDYEPVERDYHRRTGIFPMMHAVVIRRDSPAAEPEVARAVYRAFVAAKEAAAERYRQARRVYEVPSMVPWMNALFDRNLQQFGDDWWPYGLKANRFALGTNLRYQFEQGLVDRRWTPEEIFLPELLDT
ncbi:phosphate/phosphite/phosphonate ABC transporter substrate-binding protein [Mycobacterium parmense]|uniref:phosphate/phosphite/phosphonate ABC transporter substrate-binding protein n=1 Tax=Mycobacterium parmense TaxID=185642 RepID=UPI001E4901A6|nr:phosphate/phosphite/phosphonate ABC transporter substrate-binding protein [Mycobacterium parmense]